MCGIAGIVVFNIPFGNKSADLQLQRIDDAVTALGKRGPDSSGTYRHNNVALGHTRLSVIDTSDAANQPFTDHSGRYTIVYNGEFYNYREHRKKLAGEGFQFRSHSDTEALLYLYISEGPSCLEKINGFFSFAIYDNQEETLFIARDRMGIKPLLIYRDEHKLIFASEMKALLAFGIPRVIDDAALFTYLQLNYIPAPRSIFRNVEKIAPGSFIKVNPDASVEVKKYYSIALPQSAHPPVLSYEEAQKKLVSLLNDSVQRRLMADVPLGTFLSGGIDSSVITAVAAQYVNRLLTFSVGYKDEPMFDETPYALLVAKKYNTDHTVFPLSNDDLFEDLHRVLEYIDEPFADSSALPVHILSMHTRKRVKVALSGDGGDELFAGYNKHAAEYKMRNGSVALRLLKLFTPLFNHLPQSRNSQMGNFFRQLARFAAGFNLTGKERYWRWAAVMSEADAVDFIPETGSAALSSKEYLSVKRLFTDHILPATHKKSVDLNDALYADMHLVLQNDMLVKVDLMSMANGLEVRVPYLDHEVVNFAFSLPSGYKINGSSQKRILKDAFCAQLPSELYNRPKKGFEAPLLKWFCTGLKSMITDDLLHDDFIIGQKIFSTGAVKNLKSKLFSGNPGDAHATVWALIVFQTWWKKYMSG